mgnify:CR=1 FL=1
MKLQRTLPLLLLLALLAGCGTSSQPSALTAEERTQLYQTAIESARDAEMNEAIGILTDAGDDMADVIFELLGVTAADMSAFALSVSPMNIKAYGIAAIYPAAGKSDAVLEGLNAFIDRQKQSFEQYLADQYEIASNARLETLEDGTILLVMCEDQDAVFDAIRDTIEGASLNQKVVDSTRKGTLAVPFHTILPSEAFGRRVFDSLTAPPGRGCGGRAGGL